MKFQKGKNNGGFSLIEVLAAITVMAIVIGPICAGLVVSARLNARCETLLQDQLAVKSAVETLMADGIQATYDAETKDTETKGVKIVNGSFDGLKVTFSPYNLTEDTNYSEKLPYAYDVTVSSADERVVVTTVIRATDAPADTTPEGGDGGA